MADPRLPGVINPEILRISKFFPTGPDFNVAGRIIEVTICRDKKIEMS